MGGGKKAEKARPPLDKNGMEGSCSSRKEQRSVSPFGPVKTKWAFAVQKAEIETRTNKNEALKI